MRNMNFAEVREKFPLLYERIIENTRNSYVAGSTFSNDFQEAVVENNSDHLKLSDVSSLFTWRESAEEMPLYRGFWSYVDSGEFERAKEIIPELFQSPEELVGTVRVVKNGLFKK